MGDPAGGDQVDAGGGNGGFEADRPAASVTGAGRAMPERAVRPSLMGNSGARARSAPAPGWAGEIDQYRFR